MRGWIRPPLVWLLRDRFDFVDLLAAFAAINALHNGVSPWIVSPLWFLAILAAGIVRDAVGPE